MKKEIPKKNFKIKILPEIEPLHIENKFTIPSRSINIAYIAATVYLVTVAMEENTVIINHLKISKYVNGNFQMINAS